MSRAERSALELVDILRPLHDRTSCSDDDLANGFYSRHERGSGRCTRCMWLELARGDDLPPGLDTTEDIFDVMG